MNKFTVNISSSDVIKYQRYYYSPRFNVFLLGMLEGLITRPSASSSRKKEIPGEVLLDRLEGPTEKRGGSIVSPVDRYVRRAQRDKFFISMEVVIHKRPASLSSTAVSASAVILSHTVPVWLNGLYRRQKFMFINIVRVRSSPCPLFVRCSSVPTDRLAFPIKRTS